MNAMRSDKHADVLDKLNRHLFALDDFENVDRQRGELAKKSSAIEHSMELAKTSKEQTRSDLFQAMAAANIKCLIHKDKVVMISANGAVHVAEGLYEIK